MKKIFVIFFGIFSWQNLVLAQTTYYPELHWSFDTNPIVQNDIGGLDYVHDVDGDNFDDVIYASSATNTTVYLLSGKQKTNNRPNLIWSRNNLFAPGSLITAIASHQDITNNGANEILVAIKKSPTAVQVSMVDSVNGSLLPPVYNFTGNNGVTIPLLKSVPDVNYDNIQDVVVGIKNGNNDARIVMLNGANLAELWQYTYSEGASPRFTVSDITSIKDVNLDNVADVVAVIMGNPGKMVVLSGRDDPATMTTVLLYQQSGGRYVEPIRNTNATGEDIVRLSNNGQLARIRGGNGFNTQWQSSYDTVGNALRVISDINGDGFGDIVMAGNATKMVSGAATGTTVWTYNNKVFYDAGLSVIADTDEDGLPDVVGLSEGSNNAATPTTVYLLKGNTGRAIWTYNLPTGSGLGRRVLAGRDLTGDAIPEILAITQKGYVFAIAPKKTVPRPPSGPKTCFLAGTPVLMADKSTKPIEKIKVGDMIMAFDEESKAFKEDKVKKVFVHKAKEYALINNRIKATKEHLVYSQGSWVAIGKLKTGDELLNAEGQPETVKTIEIVKGRFKVYNLDVNPYHTFVAGGIVAHNRKALSK